MSSSSSRVSWGGARRSEDARGGSGGGGGGGSGGERAPSLARADCMVAQSMHAQGRPWPSRPCVRLAATTPRASRGQAAVAAVGRTGSPTTSTCRAAVAAARRARTIGPRCDAAGRRVSASREA